jgi:hypothetical protein
MDMLIALVRLKSGRYYRAKYARGHEINVDSFTSKTLHTLALAEGGNAFVPGDCIESIETET